MSDKRISRDGYVWGHVGVILFHIAIGIVMVLSKFRNLKMVVFYLGIVLIIVSILSIIPIAKKYDNITIN